MRKMVAVAALLMALLTVAGAGSAIGEVTTKPIQIALWSPAQIYPEETSILGARLNILYGVNRNVTGFDVGLINRTTGMMTGYQLGIIGVTEGGFLGWQDNVLANLARGKFVGLQTGVLNQAESGRGIQWGLVNVSDSFEGFQLGLVNKTDTLNGLQVGVLNVISKADSHPILPLINWSF